MTVNTSADIEAHLVTISDAVTAIRSICASLFGGGHSPPSASPLDAARRNLDRAIADFALTAWSEVDAVRKQLETQKTLRWVADDKAAAFGDLLTVAQSLAEGVIAGEATSELAQGLIERIRRL